MKRILAAGTPRSGTTLLQQILMAHPEGTSISETHFFEEAPDSDSLFSDSTTGRAVWDAFTAQTHVQVLTNVVSPEKLDALLEQSDNRIRLFINILDYYADTESANYWVEKTPTHLMEFPRIFREVNDLQGVIIIRDPRDTCSSLIDKPWTHDDIESNAKRWFADNTLAGMLAEALPDRIHVIRYHELVTTPDPVINRLCEELGINFHENMLHPENHAEELTFRWEEWKDNNYRPINDSAIGKYEDKLTDRQINTVAALTASVSNDLLGTEFEVSDFSANLYDTVKEQFQGRIKGLK